MYSPVRACLSFGSGPIRSRFPIGETVSASESQSNLFSRDVASRSSREQPQVWTTGGINFAVAERIRLAALSVGQSHEPVARLHAVSPDEFGAGLDSLSLGLD